MKIDIPDLGGGGILVVGDIMLDRYWHGPTSRISPEAPVPVVNVEQIEARAGGAGNVAINITSLGGQASVIGFVGNDEPADILTTVLQEKKVQCQFIVTEQNATVTKLRVISRQQQLIRLDFEDGFSGVDHAVLQQTYVQQLPSHKVVILSDYGKGTLNNIQNCIRLANQNNVPVLVDPKGTDFSRYSGATLITPNQSEFEAVVGVCTSEQDYISKGQALIKELKLQALLITRSEKGMLLLQKGTAPLVLPTKAREVFDVTGAGDTVIAALAAGIAAGMELNEATMLANFAAGVVVGKLGTAVASTEELQAAMLEHEPLQRGIAEEEQLLKLIKTAQASGERVVMTNGCFDILHAGHVAYLAQARALGDRLIVAVNDDVSVKRLKGADRPVNALMQRMAVLSALESVDWVVAFGEDTPVRLIESIKPDILVKGGDYAVEQIAGADSVIKNGGQVLTLDFIDGCSTTELINSIRKEI